MVHQSDTQVLVVGGGLAGAAAAIHLARAGRGATLIEKEPAAHDKVCGEFLSHECLGYLAELDLDPASLGAVPIHTVSLARKGRAISAQLPFQAQSLSRRVLDEALLQKAAAYGVTIRRGARVTALEKSDSGDITGPWSATIETGETLTAPHVLLATGKHDVRGWRRPPGPQADLIGFKMYWRLAPDQSAALTRQVELALFPGGYAGLEPVENGRTNLCLLVQKSAFATLEKSWERLLGHIRQSCPHLERRLTGAEPLLARPLAISMIPYGYLFEDRAFDTEDHWRLGDQAAVIPSFSGDGMSIALHSARLASKLLLLGEPASAYHTQLARDVSAQIARATRLSKALVTPWGQLAAVSLATLIPGLLTSTAKLTRIPDRALALES